MLKTKTNIYREKWANIHNKYGTNTISDGGRGHAGRRGRNVSEKLEIRTWATLLYVVHAHQVRDPSSCGLMMIGGEQPDKRGGKNINKIYNLVLQR